MKIPKPKRWEPLSLVAVVAGLCWLLLPSSPGTLLWALLPGCVLLGSGMALLLVPGNPRITSYMALGGFVGVPFALGWLLSHPFMALVCLAASATSYLAAGRIALGHEALHPEAPRPERGALMDIKAAFDEVVLGYFLVSARVPSGDEAERMCEQSFRLEQAFRERGWDRDAADFHRTPMAPEAVRVEARRDAGFEYELLRWRSGFAPDEALPGAKNWLSYSRNDHCAVRVLRHPGPPRPWLLCIHGFRMGTPMLDFSLFNPRWLHHRLGLNIIQPVLPLHGVRSVGLRSGDCFLDGDLVDLVYAEAHTLWDLRRTLAWLRQQEEAPRIGVYGVSLGGYNASLLAGFEADLDFVVAGIPVTDFAHALYRFMPSTHLRYFTAQGMDEHRYRDILRVVSPLARPATLDRDRLHIFAGAGDRIVLPYHPALLAKHWQVPVNWFQGSHLSLRYEPMVGETLREAMLRADWPANG